LQTEQMDQLAASVTVRRGLGASLAAVPRISTSPGHTFSRRNDDL